MKTVSVLIIILLPFCLYQKGRAQTVNWNALKNANHLITAGIGWDYSVSYSLGYAYRVGKKRPLLLSANFSVPSGENLLDDFKTKLGGEVVLLDQTTVKGAVTLNGIVRRYESSLVRLLNFGSEVKGALGYYHSRWFLAGEVGFDKAIVTHFQHSGTFRETIFPDVHDGWYEPASGGNFRYGIQTGFSLQKSDITLLIGRVTTEDFQSSPLIPFYLMLGYNHRID